jgi:succinate dehydrogenase / fumarate reductase, flavoprotein subunit
VSLAIASEIAEGRGVDDCILLDLRHLGRERILERLPQIRQLALDFAGVDPVESPIPVRPGAHYAMGGIKTNSWGETDMPGLFAAGECACVSIHGANRLGGNSLLETIVFGRRSGLRSAEYAVHAKKPTTDMGTLRSQERRVAHLFANEGSERPWQVREELGRTLTQRLGLVRTKDKMASALDHMKDLKVRARRVRLEDHGKIFNSDLVTALELNSLVELAETAIAGGLARQESRGAHYRRDFPERDDANWLRHTICHFSVEGPRLSYAPVVISRFPPV